MQLPGRLYLLSFRERRNRRGRTGRQIIIWGILGCLCVIEYILFFFAFIFSSADRNPAFGMLLFSGTTIFGLSWLLITWFDLVTQSQPAPRNDSKGDARPLIERLIVGGWGFVSILFPPTVLWFHRLHGRYWGAKLASTMIHTITYTVIYLMWIYSCLQWPDYKPIRIACLADSTTVFSDGVMSSRNGPESEAAIGPVEEEIEIIRETQHSATYSTFQLAAAGTVDIGAAVESDADTMSLQINANPFQPRPPITSDPYIEDHEGRPSGRDQAFAARLSSSVEEISALKDEFGIATHRLGHTTTNFLVTISGCFLIVLSVLIYTAALVSTASRPDGSLKVVPRSMIRSLYCALLLSAGWDMVWIMTAHRHFICNYYHMLLRFILHAVSYGWSVLNIRILAPVFWSIVTLLHFLGICIIIYQESELAKSAELGNTA